MFALRAHALASVRSEEMAEAVSVLEPTPARYDLALALADHGACLRRAGRRTQARVPLRRALDLAERTGAARLAADVRRDLLAVVTQATVETHLRHAFRKLGVTSRAGLPAQLAGCTAGDR